ASRIGWRGGFAAWRTRAGALALLAVSVRFVSTLLDVDWPSAGRLALTVAGAGSFTGAGELAAIGLAAAGPDAAGAALRAGGSVQAP
ncbi:hypothetical protein, partial [Methylobacterium sp. WL103]|uniref:hypothetical protein n=1 Tax=Methylobacterium sp. WL103 TaxID=2603891 RepID=UPI001AEE53C2